MMPRNFFLDEVIDDLMGHEKPRHNSLRCDLFEEKGVYNILVDIPGYDKDEISIEAKDGYLTIVAEKKIDENIEKEERKYVFHERKFGRKERFFYLGDMDQDEIKAKLENGILNICIPKIKEEESKKIIEIQ